MLSFKNRLALLDVRSDEFLNTLVQLGGYCTVEQAKQLGIAKSDTRASTQLRMFEQNGFLRRVASYPVVYQVTKAATRLRAHDRRARRPHSPDTVLNRLLAVDFYVDGCAWPSEFIFDHEMKIALLTGLGCPLHDIPHHGGKPYLWEEFFLRVTDGSITIARIDDQRRSPFSQSRNLAERFSPILRFLPRWSNLYMITGSDARLWSYERALKHPDLKELVTGLQISVQPSRVTPTTRCFAQTNQA